MEVEKCGYLLPEGLISRINSHFNEQSLPHFRGYVDLIDLSLKVPVEWDQGNNPAKTEVKSDRVL